MRSLTTAPTRLPAGARRRRPTWWPLQRSFPRATKEARRCERRCRRKAYHHGYIAWFVKIAERAGVEVAFIGSVLSHLVAPVGERWDEIAIVKYPSYAAFGPSSKARPTTPRPPTTARRRSRTGDSSRSTSSGSARSKKPDLLPYARRPPKCSTLHGAGRWRIGAVVPRAREGEAQSAAGDGEQRFDGLRVGARVASRRHLARACEDAGGAPGHVGRKPLAEYGFHRAVEAQEAQDRAARARLRAPSPCPLRLNWESSARYSRPRRGPRARAARLS